MTVPLLERFIHHDQHKRPRYGITSDPPALWRRIIGLGWSLAAGAATFGAGWLLYAEILGCSTPAGCLEAGPVAVVLGVLLAALPLFGVVGASFLSLSRHVDEQDRAAATMYKVGLWYLAALYGGLYVLIWLVKSLIRLATGG